MRAQDMLPDDQNQIERDGVVVRKGTVGAFLVNAKAWRDAAPGSDAHRLAEQYIVEALPALRTLGPFDVLAIRDAALRALVEAH